MSRFPMVALIFVVAALGLVACGGDDNKSSDTASDTTTTETSTTDTTTAGGGATIEVGADPGGQLEFVQKSLTAPAGNDTFNFTNDASIPHDFVVEDDGGQELGKTDQITKDTATVEIELTAGKYTYFCSVPGHRQAGMEGPLTVK